MVPAAARERAHCESENQPVQTICFSAFAGGLPTKSDPADSKTVIMCLINIRPSSDSTEKNKAG